MNISSQLRPILANGSNNVLFVLVGDVRAPGVMLIYKRNASSFTFC